VDTITVEDVEKIHKIKISLEGLAGRLATPILSADPKKLKALEKLSKEMGSLFKKGDTEAYAKNTDNITIKEEARRWRLQKSLRSLSYIRSSRMWMVSLNTLRS